MKSKRNIIILLTFFSLNLFAQKNSQSYHLVVSDTTWSSDTVKLAKDVVVEEFATLTINPGVFIEFQGNYSITVYGKINALGTETDSICFTINDITGFADTATYDGGWGSIKLFDNEIDTSFFSYCKFSYGKAVEINTPLFEGNQNLKGGAIYLNEYHGLSVSKCTFAHNYATLKGGGVFISHCANLILSENTFNNNKVYYDGGSVLIEYSNNAVLLNNLFYSNEAFRTDTTNLGVFGSGVGGGIAAYSNCSFINNTFANNKTVGGALYESSTNSYVCGNLIVNNFGIGLMNGHGAGTSKYLNNIVVNNKAILPGSGIYVASEVLVLKNNIVWGNTNYTLPNQSVQIPTLLGITANIKYSCIEDSYPGENNISAYPQFTNPTQGAGIEYDGLAADWTLLNTSPCVNTGTPDTTGLNLPAFDIAGNPRIYGGRIDMGAYENQYVHIIENNSLVGSKIKLYPNPGTNRIYIDIPPEVEGAFIDIVDGQGKVLMHKQIRFSPSVLSPDKLKSGIYFYRIYKTGEVVKSGKWVKR